MTVTVDVTVTVGCGACRQRPAEIAAMFGNAPSSIPIYIDVDEGVWAWACAEMVAAALGLSPETPLPEPFNSAAQQIPEPQQLLADALEALEIVGDTKRSELAGLLEDSDADGSQRRLANLRERLKRWQPPTG